MRLIEQSVSTLDVTHSELKLWEQGQLHLTPDQIAAALRLPLAIGEQAIGTTTELQAVAV